jgi:hypothetical protein
MVEWLFLDRIDTEATGAAIADQLYFVIETLTHVTQAPLTLAQAAVARAQVALQSTIVKTVPVTGFDDGLCRELCHGLSWDKLKRQRSGYTERYVVV